MSAEMWGQYGVAGLAAGLAFWAMQLARDAINKQRTGDDGTAAEERPWPACGYDPHHLRKVDEIHDYTQRTARKITAGEFNCAWQGRDEVRDLREALAANTRATETLVTEISKLEARMANGYGGAAA